MDLGGNASIFQHVDASRVQHVVSQAMSSAVVSQPIASSALATQHNPSPKTDPSIIPAPSCFAGTSDTTKDRGKCLVPRPMTSLIDGNNGLRFGPPAPQSNGGQESARADTSVNSDAGLDNQLFKDAEDGNIVCTHCDYISKQRDRMVRHFKTVHLKEKPHVCTLCTSSFGRKDKLKRHLDTVHSTAKPFKCDYCATAFNRRDKLKAHINSLHFKSTPPPPAPPLPPPIKPEPTGAEEDCHDSKTSLAAAAGLYHQYKYEDSEYHNPFTAAFLMNKSA